MKKEYWVTLLFGSMLCYSMYNWSYTIYDIISSSYPRVPWRLAVNFVITLTAIAALIQYYVSDFRRTQLLRMNLIYLLVSFTIGIFMNVLFWIANVEQREHTQIRLIITVVEWAVVIFAMKTLTAQRTPTTEIKPNEEGTIVSHYVPAELTHRFFNRVLDLALLAFITFQYSEWFTMINRYEAVQTPAVYVILTFLDYQVVQIVLEYAMLLLYYIVMESAFHTTFGKTITNTTVVNEKGGYPSWARIILRSFCRLIPADAVSFFFSYESRGWHDKLSGTGVVEETYVK